MDLRHSSIIVGLYESGELLDLVVEVIESLFQLRMLLVYVFRSLFDFLQIRNFVYELKQRLQALLLRF